MYKIILITILIYFSNNQNLLAQDKIRLVKLPFSDTSIDKDLVYYLIKKLDIKPNERIGNDIPIVIDLIDNKSFDSLNISIFKYYDILLRKQISGSKNDSYKDKIIIKVKNNKNKIEFIDIDNYLHSDFINLYFFLKNINFMILQ